MPLCEELHFKVPAHYDAGHDKYVVDCAFPAHFDAERKHWDLEAGQISWDEVMKRWKGRGPKNEEFVSMIQRGNKQLKQLLEVR